jgi:hypothetical protein
MSTTKARTDAQVRILCVVEGWYTKPMTQSAAERLLESGFPECYGAGHRIVPPYTARHEQGH